MASTPAFSSSSTAVVAALPPHPHPSGPPPLPPPLGTTTTTTTFNRPLPRMRHTTADLGRLSVKSILSDQPNFIDLFSNKIPRSFLLLPASQTLPA